jgi:hypothetical protein
MIASSPKRRMRQVATCLGSIPRPRRVFRARLKHTADRELFHDDGFDAVVTLSRRSLPGAVAMARAAGRKLVEKLVPDMQPGSLAAATIDGDVEGFSVLGVGANTGKLTLGEHRAVDVVLNEAFARALRDSGKVEHLAFMSAVGANPKAGAGGNGAAGMPRYNRVKGESEEAVRASGPAR